HEGEAVVRCRAWPAANRGRPAEVRHGFANLAHSRRVDARPVVQHPIDRGRTDAGRFGNLCDGDLVRHGVEKNSKTKSILVSPNRAPRPRAARKLVSQDREGYNITPCPKC